MEIKIPTVRELSERMKETVVKFNWTNVERHLTHIVAELNSRATTNNEELVVGKFLYLTYRPDPEKPLIVPNDIEKHWLKEKLAAAGWEMRGIEWSSNHYINSDDGIYAVKLYVQDPSK